MNANTRIQWLHKKLSQQSYPNAQRLVERFGISHRQAQRDFEHLKKKLGAPVAYNATQKGFYYTAPYSLPVLLSSDNDENYIPDILSVQSDEELAADSSVIQMQIPYTATVEIPQKLAVMELTPYILERESGSRYACEFHSIEKFIGALFSSGGDFRIIEPEWLREKMLARAEAILQKHTEQ